MSLSATVLYSSPLRGAGNWPTQAQRVSGLVITRGWGSQPATALIDWATPLPVDPPPPGAMVRAEVAGHVFWGVLTQPEHVLAETGFGQAHTAEDFRHFLDLDVVYGVFNRADHQVVDGQLVRRFKHLLPVNVAAAVWTYTPGPLTAAEVLTLLLGSPWVESPWEVAWMNSMGAEVVGEWHPVLQSFPVFEVDYSGGQKLGAALAEISQRVGLTFGIAGHSYFGTIRDGWRLCWVLRGDGGRLPLYTWSDGRQSVFPEKSTNRRLGTQYAGNPSRLSVVGEANRYQVLNVVMEPDWLPGWEALWRPLALAEDIYLHEKDEAGRAYATDAHYWDGDDPTPGWLAAAARAERVTVGEFAAMRDARTTPDGASFRDTRRYQGRSRLSLPAALYVQALVFRAYRVAAGQTIVNAYGRTVDLRALRIAGGAVQDVTYNPATGLMSAAATYQANGNGLAIAQGVKLLSEDMQLFRPEYFDAAAFGELNDRWSELSFQVDESGEGHQFITFDERVVRTDNLCVSESSAGSRVLYVPVRNPTVTPAPVRAALVFAGERFNYTAGGGQRDQVETASGLSAELVVSAPGGAAVEIPFADGLTASAKANAIAASWLGRQLWYVSGGYLAQLPYGTRLHPMHSRVTVRHGVEGTTEEVDFTAERPQQADANGSVIIEPPREFERRTLEWGQVAGLREQRQRAEELRTQAVVLGGPKGTRWRREAREAWEMMQGYGDVKPLMLEDVSLPAAVAAGTPLWREADGRAPVAPGRPLTKPVFMGVAVPKTTPGSGPVPVTASGDGGVVLARVTGPVTAGDGVGYDEGTALKKGGTPGVGTVLDTLTEAEGAKLVRVRVGTATTGNLRLYLCDPLTGVGKYYRVAGEEDPDQTPEGSGN